jgi:hypothetical protein
MPREGFEPSFLDFKSSVLTIELSGLFFITIYLIIYLRITKICVNIIKPIIIVNNKVVNSI